MNFFFFSLTFSTVSAILCHFQENNLLIVSKRRIHEENMSRNGSNEVGVDKVEKDEIGVVEIFSRRSGTTPS